MIGKTLLKGHIMGDEGCARGDDGMILWDAKGPGRGKCSCGALSEILPTRAARKRWHREHKDAIRNPLTPPSPKETKE